jgi:hypothetical protein
VSEPTTEMTGVMGHKARHDHMPVSRWSTVRFRARLWILHRTLLAVPAPLVLPAKDINGG